MSVDFTEEQRLCEDLFIQVHRSMIALNRTTNDDLRLIQAKTVNDLIEAYVKLKWHK